MGDADLKFWPTRFYTFPIPFLIWIETFKNIHDHFYQFLNVTKDILKEPKRLRIAKTLPTAATVPCFQEHSSRLNCLSSGQNRLRLFTGSFSKLINNLLRHIMRRESYNMTLLTHLININLDLSNSISEI